MRAKIELTKEDRTRICDFLDRQYKTAKFTQEEWWTSYQSWVRGGHAWNALDCGGTGIQTALAWYQYRHKVGSKEWRPSIIIKALKEASL